jgi:hypothetical protein
METRTRNKIKVGGEIAKKKMKKRRKRCGQAYLLFKMFLFFLKNSLSFFKPLLLMFYTVLQFT